MKVSVLLLLGTSMFPGGMCDNKQKKELPFFVDIVVPNSGGDLGARVEFIHDTLYTVEGIKVNEAFKVKRHIRLSVVRSDALCAWSPLEDALFAANISMTVTSLYRAEDLVNGLTSTQYKEVIRESTEYVLRRRTDGLQELSYQVLGDLPFRLLMFSVLSP
ncbi:uncharacterized protein [Haliotis asinina]|uniref:uncharacterized protein n=1 Tax=Haliotis asinina TaxID=109174 RepID=UPI003531A898